MKRKQEIEAREEEEDIFSEAAGPRRRISSREHGQDFMAAIENLARGGYAPVSTATTLSVQYQDRRKGNRGLVTIPKGAHYQAKSHEAQEKSWQQGFFASAHGESTAFFSKKGEPKILPEDLTMERATIEAQVMKGVAKQDYKPQNIWQMARGESEDKAWGMPTLGSYNEDVTGERGLGLVGVGSAVRASIMSVKWKQMEQKDRGSVVEPDKDFAAKLLKAFPQLGNNHMKDEQEHKLGASEVFNTMEAEQSAEKNDTLNAHIGEGGSIYQAHMGAIEAAKQRFETKFQRIKTGEQPDAVGKWWDTELGGKDLSTIDEATLRRSYVQKKMDAHGIDTGRQHKQLANMRFREKLEANEHETADKGWWSDNKEQLSQFKTLEKKQRNTLINDYAKRKSAKIETKKY